MSELTALSTLPTRILLPIDFSSSSQAALEMAADLAHHFRASLYLVHVIPLFPTTTFPDYIPETAFIDQARSYGELHLKHCHSVLAAKNISSRWSVEAGLNPALSIMDVVERENINLIIISTHGISGWHPFVFGSIAEKVVKLARCPLLLLRSAETVADTLAASGNSSRWW